MRTITLFSLCAMGFLYISSAKADGIHDALSANKTMTRSPGAAHDSMPISSMGNIPPIRIGRFKATIVRTHVERSGSSTSARNSLVCDIEGSAPVYDRRGPDTVIPFPAEEACMTEINGKKVVVEISAWFTLLRQKAFRDETEVDIKQSYATIMAKGEEGVAYAQGYQITRDLAAKSMIIDAGTSPNSCKSSNRWAPELNCYNDQPGDYFLARVELFD